MDIGSLRTWVKTFDGKIAETCPRGARQCRGGSQSLYHLLRNSPDKPARFDASKLNIWTGGAHTFLRYDDPALGAVYIDPTFSQINTAFDGTFVGTREELEKAIKERTSNAIDMTDFTGNNTYPGPLKKETSLMGGTARKTRRKRRLRHRKSHKNRR